MDRIWDLTDLQKAPPPHPRSKSGDVWQYQCTTPHHHIFVPFVIMHGTHCCGFDTGHICCHKTQNQAKQADIWQRSSKTHWLLSKSQNTLAVWSHGRNRTIFYSRTVATSSQSWQPRCSLKVWRISALPTASEHSEETLSAVPLSVYKVSVYQYLVIFYN